MHTQNSQKKNNVEEIGEIWYYGVQLDHENDNTGHSFVYNPKSGIFYEINHPIPICEDGPGIDGSLSGLLGFQSGRVVSVGWSFDMSMAGGSDEFWNFRCGRAMVKLSPVYVPNPAAAIQFFESWVGRSWDYSLLTKNCKHFVIEGLRAGGAKIINKN